MVEKLMSRSRQHIDGMSAVVYVLHVDGVQLAHLDVHADCGLILNVEVAEDHRGEGHARALYEYAAAERDIYHVPAWGCSEDGKAFAAAVGGDVMDDEDAIAALGFDDDQADHIRMLIEN